ncbi:TPA: hypothetical protein JTC75_003935, partial [Escherichia coli]|nr:hypothetical protein [Escherichia coli]HBC1707083.1 hypothetical protein [Escherichia coli]
NHLVINSSAITAAAGEVFTTSARIKTTSDRIRIRFTLAGAQVGDINFDGITGSVVGTPSGQLTYSSSLGADGYIFISVTITMATAGVVTGQIYFNGASTIPDGANIFVQTVQLEKNSIATSYIPTGSAEVTRAADSASLQPSGNVGYRAVGDLFNRTIAFELAINSFAPSATGFFDLIKALGVTNDIILRATATSLSCLRSSGNISPAINVSYPVNSQIFSQTIDTSNKLTAYFGTQSGSRTGPPSSPTSIPTSIKFDAASNVVYHIRNFRIWQRLLTSIQIKGLR